MSTCNVRQLQPSAIKKYTYEKHSLNIYANELKSNKKLKKTEYICSV